jgi:hypothetical protein
MDEEKRICEILGQLPIDQQVDCIKAVIIRLGLDDHFGDEAEEDDGGAFGGLL